MRCVTFVRIEGDIKATRNLINCLTQTGVGIGASNRSLELYNISQAARHVSIVASYVLNGDTSRVGGGNPELGRMMAEYNNQALLRSLYAYRDNLEQIIELIEQEKWDNLAERLQTNQQSSPEFIN